MKIVQLIYSLSSGGAERFVTDLSNFLSCDDHEVHVVILRNNIKCEFYKEFLNKHIIFHNLNIEAGFGLDKVYKITRYIKDLNPDVVHSHLNVIPYIYPMALFYRKIKFIHTLHSVAEHTVGSRAQAILNYFFYKFDLITPVTISNQSNKSYQEFYNLPAASVIYNGCREIKATEAFESAKRELQYYLQGKRMPVFIHVGRFDVVKNQDLLISAFNRLNSKGVDFLLLIIGSGFENAELLQRRACDAIKFLGEKSNVGDYLMLSDAFCLTSHFEGLPISLLEALCAGCVPICTSVGGIPDVIIDGINGYLADGINVDSYCRALERFIENPTAIDQSDLKTYFDDKFLISDCAKKYLRLYAKT